MERGESAKTADRPELQRMLAYVAENPVKYVIVHKVDRLARNRADDVDDQPGAQAGRRRTGRVSENIDQTPSGLLLHGIMSSIAEFYSRNLATEVIKGSVQKAKNGGTPGRAPTRLPERPPLRERPRKPHRRGRSRARRRSWPGPSRPTRPATGRSARLLAELTDRGLTTAPGPRSPGRPLTVSHLHKLLRHPYYTGIVRYRGAIYPGKHEPLVDARDLAAGPGIC